MSEKNVHRLPIRKTALSLIGELGSESNAHGVARIVRSHDSRRKVVWSLLVLLGVGAAISQLSSLVHKYLQYQVVEVSEIQDGHPVEFPSVTVCNIEPISWRKLRELLNGTTSNSSDVRAWVDFLETFRFGSQEPHLRSIRAFRENVGQDAQYVQHSLDESVLHCSFNKQPCLGNFTTSFDGNYYSCFTFNTQPSNPAERLIVHSTGPEYGLSLVMFLDNNEPPLGTYGVYTLDTNILHSAGVRVMVHAPNTLPIPVDHGQDVAPGFSTSVSIKPYLHARLPQPYGNCSDTRLRGLNNFTSTFSTCIAVCKQELVARRCRCRSSALPQVPALEELPYCGQILNWRHMLRNKHVYNRTQHLPTLECEVTVMARLKNDRGYETNCGCTHPCGELSYHMSTSMSYWPTEYYQYDALNKLYGETAILDSPLGRAYKLHDINIDDGLQIRQELHRQAKLHGSYTAEPPTGSDSEGERPQDREDLSGNSRNQMDQQSQNVQFGPNDSGSNRTLNSSTSDDWSGNSSQAAAGSGSNADADFSEQLPPQKPLSLEYTPQHLDNLREASTDIRQNLLRLNVYLEDLSVVKFKQMPAYGMEDLFADIGGTLGLWMGVSVLTIMELLELISRLSYLFLRAEWKPGGPNLDEGQRDSRERETRPRERSPYEDKHHAEDPRDGVKGNESESDGEHHNDRGHGGYSYSSDVEFRRAADDGHLHHDLFEANGHSTGSANNVVPQQRTEYSGRTKYWRLKRAKSKR